MPVAFPSHQGLILPLWKRFPSRIDGVALSVGAAMPDVVDFVAWPLRGELGQWMGHSFVGIVAACVPAGLALTWLARVVVPRRWLVRLEDDRTMRGVVTDGLSVGVGALSHVVFDLVTHCNFLLVWPWYRGDHLFPEWWCRPWIGIPLPVYREPYPLAPHTIVWFVLSVLGVVLFVRCLRPR